MKKYIAWKIKDIDELKLITDDAINIQEASGITETYIDYILDDKTLLRSAILDREIYLYNKETKNYMKIPSMIYALPIISKANKIINKRHIGNIFLFDKPMKLYAFNSDLVIVYEYNDEDDKDYIKKLMPFTVIEEF